MSKSRHLILRTLLFLLLPILAAASPGPEFEKPPTLPAPVLAPASLLSGDGFRVNNEVPTEGYLGHFIIHSDVGTFKAHSLEMLRIRVAELPAIVELTKTSKTKVFAQALATNAAAPVAAAGQMVMHPVETVQGLPSGVGRFFGRVGLGRRAAQGEGAATEPEGLLPEGEKAGNFATRTGETTRDILGYEQERRAGQETPCGPIHDESNSFQTA